MQTTRVAPTAPTPLNTNPREGTPAINDGIRPNGPKGLGRDGVKMVGHPAPLPRYILDYQSVSLFREAPAGLARMGLVRACCWILPCAFVKML